MVKSPTDHALIPAWIITTASAVAINVQQQRNASMECAVHPFVYAVALKSAVHLGMNAVVEDVLTSILIRITAVLAAMPVCLKTGVAVANVLILILIRITVATAASFVSLEKPAAIASA